MSEAEAIDADEILVTPESEAGPGPGAVPEVAYVLPAPAEFGPIATTDEAVAPDRSPSPLPSQSTPDLRPIDGVEELGRGLHRKLDELRTLFDREVRAEGTREKVVDRLHAELQEYKQGLIGGILRPVFVDLIQLHDDIGKMVDAPSGDAAAPEVRRLLDLMRGYQQGIEDILYRQGVEPFAEDGDAFDPRRQRALAAVPTDDPARNKRVAARVRKGFQAGEKVIRPEMVTVYSSRPPAGPRSD